MDTASCHATAADRRSPNGPSSANKPGTAAYPFLRRRTGSAALRSDAGPSPGGVASGNRLDGEVGYGLPVGSRFVGTPRVGFSTSEYGRDYRAGYGLGLLNRGSLSLELGIDAQRRESPLQGAASNGVLGRATLGW